MVAIAIVNAVDRMVGDNVFFPRQKGAEVCRQGLAVSCELRVAAVTANVID